MSWLIGLMLAGGVGLSMGLLGGGGAVLAVPIMVYVMGIPVKSAVAMTLIIIGTISLLGAAYHWWVGNLNVSKGVKFGLAMLPGSYLGGKIATLPFVTGGRQMILLGVVIVIAAVLMLTRAPAPTTLENATLEAYHKPFCRRCGLWMMTEGLGVGVLTGLVGVGGGFAIVPALVLLGDTPIKQAIPTSLLVIAISSVGGLFGYWGHVTLDVPLLIEFTVVTSVGLIGGLLLSRVVPIGVLQRLFGFLLIVVAGVIFLQARA